MYTYPGGERFSFPFPDFDDPEDETPCSGIVGEAKSYADKGKLGSAVEIWGRTITFDNAAGRILSRGREEHPEAGDNTPTDETALPAPEPYTGPHSSVLDYYYSQEYAGARTLGEAIEMRGERAFAENVEPEDFSDLPGGVERLGIASLWSQSTFSADGGDRDLVTERQANSLARGDLLIVSLLPPEMEIEGGGTWSEVDGWGFGFFKPDGTLLPFSCYHDYDLNLILDTLLTLERGQLIACAVRDMTCNGADNECADEEDGFPGFGWRVYSCEVTVLRITL